jgi:hypothetical protein
MNSRKLLDHIVRRQEKCRVAILLRNHGKENIYGKKESKSKESKKR